MHGDVLQNPTFRTPRNGASSPPCLAALFLSALGQGHGANSDANAMPGREGAKSKAKARAVSATHANRVDTIRQQKKAAQQELKELRAALRQDRAAQFCCGR